jgi:hypothetical protein
MTAFYCGDLDLLEVGWGSEGVGKQIVRFGYVTGTTLAGEMIEQACQRFGGKKSMAVRASAPGTRVRLCQYFSERPH